MSEKTTENTQLKRSIDDSDLFDLPMVGILGQKVHGIHAIHAGGNRS